MDQLGNAHSWRAEKSRLNDRIELWMKVICRVVHALGLGSGPPGKGETETLDPLHLFLGLAGDQPGKPKLARSEYTFSARAQVETRQ
jgi:hypothetical protein